MNIKTLIFEITMFVIFISSTFIWIFLDGFFSILNAIIFLITGFYIAPLVVMAFSNETLYYEKGEVTPMLEILRRIKPKQTVTAKQIHDEFDRVADALVRQAKELLAKNTESEMVEIAALARMGFSNTPEAKKVSSSNLLRNKIKLASYYKESYANKFITEEEVKRICEKYGLVFGNANDFIGSIPSQCRKEILGMKVFDKDCLFENTNSIMNYKYIHADVDDIMKNKPDEVKKNGMSFNKAISLKIVATQDLFDMRSKKLESGYKIVDQDPIVLFPVNGGYLIVTKWGNEKDIV